MSERDDIDTDELAAKRTEAEKRSAREWIRQARNRLNPLKDAEK